MRAPWPLNLTRRLLAISGLLLGQVCHAEGTLISDSQLNVNWGMVSGSFTGGSGFKGSISVPTSIDVGYEVFSSSRKSLLFRAILSNNLSESRIAYSYAGVSRRYYLGSSGMGFTNSDGVTNVVSIPQRRFYAGVDVGVSQVLVAEQGPVLQVNSGLIDFGGHLGAIFQMSPTIGINAQVGMAFGYGFSAIAVSGTINRIFLGITYFL